MTIASLDNFGHASGSISMSELRDYYGQSGSVSLNGNLNGGTNPVPSSLPASGAATSFSNYRSKNRILKKKGTTETKASGSSWTPAQSGCVQYNVYVVGGGGSGGGHSTNSGREKVASGGAAGGTAFRRYSVQDHGITSASISIGAGGAGVSYPANSGYAISGRNGGTTTFNPNGSGLTILAYGGSRGFAGRQTAAIGNASTTTDTSDWGTCSRSYGGSSNGGQSNYTGGYGPGLSIGGNDEQAYGGGSPNLGSGGKNGKLADGANGATTDAPTKPSEWGSDVSATFRGGYAACNNNGAAGASQAGASYGAGSGGSAGESGAGSTGNGSSGAIFVTYYEINT